MQLRAGWLGLFLIACAGPGLEPPGDDTAAPIAGAGAHAGQGGSAGAGALDAGLEPGTGGGGGTGAGAGDFGNDDGGEVVAPHPDAGQGPRRDTGWAESCGDVSAVGHCVGDVLEWCDWFTSGLRQLDCGALGLQCRAGLWPNMDEDGSGCVGEPCSQDDASCDGALVYECRGGMRFVRSCERAFGPSAQCSARDGEAPGCSYDLPCDREFERYCDGTELLECTADGLVARDCRNQDETGTCVATDDVGPQCDPR